MLKGNSLLKTDFLSSLIFSGYGYSGYHNQKTILMKQITFWHEINPVLWDLSYLER
jgi:hypothetical protein